MVRMDSTQRGTVWLAEGAYLCTRGARYDVHNDFDARGLEVDWTDATLKLILVRAQGRWVDPNLPSGLRLTLRHVRDLVVTGWSEGNSHRRDINLIAYTSWAAPLADRDVWLEEDPEADALAIEFGDGSYLRVRAELWELSEEAD